jgi:predicted DCC family thiol-disulfide oxidoreductase YuxK
MCDNTLRILLFDGVCNLCNGLVQFIIRRDDKAKFKFAPFQSDKGLQLLNHYGFPQDQFDFILYIREGKCYIKSTAILKILRDLGGIWKFYYSLIIIPKFIRDLFYNIIAKNRYRLFGKLDHCIIPSPDIRQRFL